MKDVSVYFVSVSEPITIPYIQRHEHYFFTGILRPGRAAEVAGGEPRNDALLLGGDDPRKGKPVLRSCHPLVEMA